LHSKTKAGKTVAEAVNRDFFEDFGMAYHFVEYMLGEAD
jgi:hypothetical protein